MRPPIYGNAHKGLRKALFELALLAGSCDYADNGSLENLKAKLDEVVYFLDFHAHLEEDHILPLLETKRKGCTEHDATDHIRIDGMIEEMKTALNTIQQMAPTDRAKPGYLFYLQVNNFVSAYNTHMYQEETVTAGLLDELCSDDEVVQLFGTIMKANTPDSLGIMLPYMVPAMNRHERAAMFTGAKKSMPAPVFQGIMAMAEKLISGDEFRHLKAAVG